MLPEVMRLVLPYAGAGSICIQYYTYTHMMSYVFHCFPIFPYLFRQKKSTSRVQGVRPWTICIIYPTRPGTWKHQP